MKTAKEFLISNYADIAEAVDNGYDIRLDEAELLKAMEAYASQFKSPEQKSTEEDVTKSADPNDVAYTMHQLQMLVNYLEDLGIKAKWEGTHWAVEQSGILLKFLDWYDGDLKVLKDHELLIHEYFTEKLN